VSAIGSTRVSLVEVRIEGAEGITLRSGASCTARITTSVKEDALLIPLASFLTEDNASFVYLLAPAGKTNASGAEVFGLSRHAVTTGASDINSVEIVSGLKEGDTIASGNLKNLRDGILVTLRQDSSP
jgi:hypothetical protein